MPYLDTSVLVSALTQEGAGFGVLDLIGVTPSLHISDWVVTEFSAALSIKVRTGALNQSNRSVVASMFQELTTRAMQVHRVRQAHFRHAAHLADHHPSGLRAGDSLHLAIAADVDGALWTLDKRLHAAGAMLGVATRLL